MVLLVSAALFVMMALVPGDVTQQIYGNPATSGLPPSAYKELRHQLGLDQPLPEQYWHWLTNAMRGDLGRSLITAQPITHAITQRFPVTLSLVLGAVLLSTVVGVGLGVVSAVRGGRLGLAVDILSVGGWIVPVYWIAAEMIVLFAVKIRWFPATGYVPFTDSPSGWLRSLALPVVALALHPIGVFAKFTREGMSDALSSEYVRIARAAGASPASIVFRHALKTAAPQIVTLAGGLTVGLVIGAVFVENVFALPGLGSLLVSSTIAHDLTMVQGITVLFTIIVVLINLLVDLSYSLLNPKVRVS